MSFGKILGIDMKKDYFLGVYEKSMPDALSLKDKLICAKKAGFDFVELSIDETDAKLGRLEMSADERAKLAAEMAEAECRFKSICLSGNRRFPLGSGRQGIAQRGVDIMQKCIALAYDLGVRIIQIAGYDVYYEEKSTVGTKERFIENLKKCVDTAAEYGIILALETMENDFMNTIEKAMYYVNVINSPYLQVYPDVGNISNSTDNVTKDIRSGRGHIVAAHLKETKEGIFRDLMFGDGDVDFQTVTSVLKNEGITSFTAEFWWKGNEDWMKDEAFANEFLRKYLDMRS